MKLRHLKTFVFSLFLLSGISSLVSASNFTVQVRESVLFPESKRVKEVYGKHLRDFDVVVSKWIDERWDLYIEMGMMSEKGRSLGSKNRTRMHLFPVAVGMKYYMPVMKQLDFYLGAGGLYGHLRVHDHSSHTGRKHYSRNAWGGIANSGFRFSLSESMFIDLFADYQFLNFHFSGSHKHVKRHDFNMSGPRVGLGIGFNL